MDRSDPKQVTIWLARGIAYLAYAYLIIVEIILIQGFLLKLFGANTGSSYVDWAYRSLDRVMAPFRGIFEPVQLDGNAVLDTSIIFAMVIYGILAIVVNSLLDWLTYRLQRAEQRRLLTEAREQAEATSAYAAGYGASYAPTPTAAPPAAAPSQPSAPAPAHAAPEPQPGAVPPQAQPSPQPGPPPQP